jgi:LmbE family N-acetylglucosaminyl deacetylase
MLNIKNALVIGAHFDDAELGAGGTAAKLSSQGIKIYKLTLTDNHVKESVFNQKTDGEESRKDSLKACEILGIHSLDDEFEPSRVCELSYKADIMQRVESLILDYNIDTVFIHDDHDVNQDHAESGRISRTAARHCKNILVYQSNMYVMAFPFTPSVFFDITEYVDLKKAALDVYGQEHQRFAKIGDTANTLFDHVIMRNKVWGYSTGTTYAEGFHPIKMTF